MNSSLNLAFGMGNGTVKPVPESELRGAKDFRGAVQTCIKLSQVKRTQNDLALLVGMNATQLSKCINGPFHLPGDVIALVEKHCGNTAITQWLALQHNATLKVETAEERLLRENEELRAQLARVAA